MWAINTIFVHNAQGVANTTYWLIDNWWLPLFIICRDASGGVGTDLASPDDVVLEIWKSLHLCSFPPFLLPLCPVLALSSLDPVLLLVWSWQQNAGTFPLMCHCVAHIGSLSSWHAARSHFWTFSFLNCLDIKLGKKRAKSGYRKAHWRYFDKM